MSEPSTKPTVRVGIIGGGLMGKEAASAFGRWFVLNDFPVNVELVGVADLSEPTLEWFKQVPTVRLLTTDYKELLAERHPAPPIEFRDLEFAPENRKTLLPAQTP